MAIRIARNARTRIAEIENATTSATSHARAAGGESPSTPESAWASYRRYRDAVLFDNEDGTYTIKVDFYLRYTLYTS